MSQPAAAVIPTLSSTGAAGCLPVTQKGNKKESTRRFSEKTAEMLARGAAHGLRQQAQTATARYSLFKNFIMLRKKTTFLSTRNSSLLSRQFSK